MKELLALKTLKKRGINGMKKLLVLTVLAALLISATACGNEANEPTVPVNESTVMTTSDDGSDEELDGNGDREMMEFTVKLWDADSSFGDETCEIYQYIQDRFQITFKPYSTSWDNFEELAMLWAASGTLPEIIGSVAMVGQATYFEWIDVGIVRSIPDDMVAKYPHVQQVLQQPYSRDFQVNGSNFMIPRISVASPEHDVMTQGIINRRDWRESLDIPVPETIDDFLNMWKAFVANDMNGDGSPVFGLIFDNPGTLLNNTFANFGDTRGTWVMQPDGSMVIPALEHQAIPHLSFLRAAWRDGLIDPDFITQATWVSIETFAGGGAGTLMRQANPIHLERVYNSFVVLQPERDFSESIEVLVAPRGPETRFFTGGGFWSETYFNASLSDERLERILEYYDWAMSAEGMRMMVYGFEGVDWREDADGEIIMLTDIDPETGVPMGAGHLYQYARGGMPWLAIWPQDYLMWEAPTIPRVVRDMSTEVLNSIIDDPNSKYVVQDSRISSLNVEKVNEMAINIANEWVAFLTDTSNLSDEDLFEQFYARWVGEGYEAAKEAMTLAAQEAGITYGGN